VTRAAHSWTPVSSPGDASKTPRNDVDRTLFWSGWYLSRLAVVSVCQSFTARVADLIAFVRRHVRGGKRDKRRPNAMVGMVIDKSSAARASAANVYAERLYCIASQLTP
jgi:hypothetical protein